MQYLKTKRRSFIAQDTLMSTWGICLRKCPLPKPGSWWRSWAQSYRCMSLQRLFLCCNALQIQVSLQLDLKGMQAEQNSNSIEHDTDKANVSSTMFCCRWCLMKSSCILRAVLSLKGFFSNSDILKKIHRADTALARFRDSNVYNSNALM